MQVRRKHDSERVNKVILWFAFEVLISFIPLVLGAFALVVNGDNQIMANILIHGGLALISVSIAAGVFGDLYISRSKTPHQNHLRHDLAFIGSFLVAIFGVLWYFSTANQVKFTVNTSFGSIFLGAVTLIVGGIGKWKAGEE